MASVSLKAITKRFGKVVALSGVDLHVEDGEFCVLLGPSGCGKSTLLNIIAGLIPQDEGTVLLDGEPVDRLAPRDRDVAMVFQSYALYPHMTVSRNLSFGLRMRGVPKPTIHKQVLETARLLGIEDLLDRKPRELSGGQRQRVAMGRAMVRKPKLFLLDEPLSNLDARLRSSVRLDLKRVHRQIKGTIVYVTHDQVEAMTLGDRVVVMRDGKVCQIDRPETIYARPVDTFVATFIGSPEMNLYQGRLVCKDGRTHFQGPGFSLDLGGLQINLEEGKVELGIRPEDIRIGQGGTTVLEAKVEMLSNVGSEKYIHARLGQEGLTVRAPKEAAFEPGQVIPLTIDPGRVHIFHEGCRL
ncbi:MAG: ABC transporter ATP-binding protein [Deltaproteobacteria bacterium]|nr:ABC transporter ATP-binding protein [Deltaproteobacteria bacterium]MBW1793025.1 ABC transporter ATP-binding protein [Deltaproteobacteria bacterium]MBW2329591.1 ABC transporter ATP-binding protein [Deltaproteobacteria bacterium]